MKKRIEYLFLLFWMFLFSMNIVYAADYSISLTSTSVTVGNDVTLRIDGTGSGLTGRFNISTSDSSVASISDSSVWIEKNVGNVKISAKKAGSAVITVTPSDGISDSDANEVSLQKRTITITVNNKPTPTVNNTNNNSNNNSVSTRTKSSNNFLTSITIDGLELKEKFDKETLEYNLDVPADTEEIKINAQLADSNAKISGVGNVKVSTGLNVLELTVTAENGSKRTYKINANVLEVEPIKVTIDKSEYTVIRKRNDLPKISDYNVPKDITINNNIIEGYYNEKLNYDLVGLKDNKGKISFYIYNKGKYSKYDEYTFGGSTLQIIDKKVDGYKKTSFTYGNDKIASYQEVKLDLLKNTYALDNNNIVGNQFYLFYAKNVETGKENLYQYDAIEKTVQRYNLEVLNMYKSNLNTYYMYLLFSLILSVVLIVSILLLIISNNKKNQFNKTRRKELDLMRLEEE